MGRRWSENKVLNEVTGDNEKQPKAMHKFKKKLNGHDYNRMKRQKKERDDELQAHIDSHQGQVKEALQNIMHNWKITYIHPAKRYMTLTHPEWDHKKFTVNGEDNVSEIEGWVGQYGFNYGIYLPGGPKGGNTVLPADWKEQFNKNNKNS